MCSSKLTPFVDAFPKIGADDLLEVLRELRQGTTCTTEQEENRIEIEPCIKLLNLVVGYLAGGNTDNAIDKFVLAVCARVGVQFIGNCVVDNSTNQRIVWNHSDTLREILTYDDNKMRNYTCMVLYNIMLSNIEYTREMVSNKQLLDLVLEQARDGISEFPQLMVDKWIESNFDDIFTEGVSHPNKIYILDRVSHLIRDGSSTLQPSGVSRIVDLFQKAAGRILNGDPSNENSDDDPLLTVKLVSTLGSLSGHDSYRTIISNNSSLLIQTIYLLRGLDMAESASDKSEGKSILERPADGFKSHLIRLIGNMCYKNTANQNSVREHSCIQIILKSTTIDLNNPFVREWSIVAIRNICEDNTENQTFIDSLKQIDESQIINGIENVDISGGDHSEFQ